MNATRHVRGQVIEAIRVTGASVACKVLGVFEPHQMDFAEFTLSLRASIFRPVKGI